MNRKIRCLFFFLIVLIFPGICQATVTILSDTIPDHTISSGSNEQVYGTLSSNQITLESGAGAELINFPGQNTIEIQSSYDLFTVSRSGTVVTFQGTDDTFLKIPATQTAQVIEFTNQLSLTLSIHNGQVLLDEQVITTTPAAIEVDFGEPPGPCGANVGPNIWKEFDCYNLAAIGKTTNDDPFTPSWRLIGGYWQWGIKGVDGSQWYYTNTDQFRHGPTGPDIVDANEGGTGWSWSYAPDSSWSDSEKTSNDPCPAGFRLPTQSQWQGVHNYNIETKVGTWTNGDTNYGSASYFGAGLMLPAAGAYNYQVGTLSYRGSHGFYWSSSQDENSSISAWYLYFSGTEVLTTYSHYRTSGFSVRCIAE